MHGTKIKFIVSVLYVQTVTFGIRTLQLL